MRPRPARLLVWIAAAATLAAFVTLAPPPPPSPAGAVARGGGQEPVRPATLPATLPADLQAAVATAVADGAAMVSVQVTAGAGTSAADLQSGIDGLGGDVRYVAPRLGYVQAEVPPAAVPALPAVSGAGIVGLNAALRVQAAAVRQVPAAVARDGFALNLGAMRVPEADPAFGPSRGSGVVVALIDSGVNAAHPDLLRTPDGRRKVIDWQDFTGEGEVPTPTEVAVAGGEILAPQGRFVAPAQAGDGDPYRLGFLREARLGGIAALDLDFDHNGRRTDEFAVLVNLTDPAAPVVYVDTNRNQSFADETGLRPFRLSGQVERFGRRLSGGEDVRPAFVVADVAADGSQVVLGFDALGHGTHVAGTMAAAGPGMTGLAPGAQLIALKALGSNGQGDWFRVVQAMEYAARAGAHVINLSVEQLQAAAGSRQAVDAVLRRMADEYGVLVVVAAGNGGPGAGTALVPGDADRILTVGGYYSPQIWERDYGYRLPLEGLWPQSAAGPRPDGSLAPNVTAPASGPGPASFFQASSGYQVRAGTSVAAAHVTGAAAALMAAARDQGRTVDVRQVIRALEMGARSLDGYLPFEQGYGLVNVEQAWAHLQRLPPVLPLSARIDGGSGLFAREYVPGRSMLSLANQGQALRVNLVGNASWLQPERQSLVLPAAGGRQVGIELRPPTEPGIYGSFLTVRAPERYGYDLQVPITFVVPHALGADGRLSLRETKVAVGRYRRHYVRVPAGATNLNFTLRIDRAADGAAAGRVQAYLFRPDGEEAFRSPVLGKGSTAGAAAIANLREPLPGTWELLIRSDAELTQFSATPYSTYEFELAVQAIQAEPLPVSVAQAGGTADTTVRLTTAAADFTGAVTAAGPVAATVAPGIAPATTAIRSVGGQVERLEIKGFVPLARFAVTPLGDSPGVGLALYRYNRITQALDLFDRSEARDGGRRVLEVRDLPPGTYSVFVDVPQGSYWSVRYEYQRHFFDVGPAFTATDTARLHRRGDTWSVPLHLQVPARPGRYRRFLLVQDTTAGRIVSVLPVEVVVGEPSLAVQVLSPYWVQGRSGRVTVEISRADTGDPFTGPATIGGLRYQVENGQVTVPLPSQPPVLDLAVAVDAPGYAPIQTSRRLGARPEPGMAPVGIPSTAAGDWPDWRRKVLTELQQTFGVSPERP